MKCPSDRPSGSLGAAWGLQKLTVVWRKISELKLDPNNPRKHSRRQLHALASSIKKFGFNGAVLIDANDKLIAGEGRILACSDLAWDEVPTICLGHLSEAKARAFRVADNRVSELSTWDIDLLVKEVDLIMELDADLKIDDLGFEAGAFDELTVRSPRADNVYDEEEEPPCLQEGVSVAKRGDIWTLGAHCIVCGDALDAQTYFALMEEEQAQLVITDPPYNVKIDGNVGGLGRIHHREFAMASGEMTEAEFKGFLLSVCSLMAQFSQDGALHFLFMDWRHMGEILAAGRKVYTELKNLCVWVKDNAGMGSLYRSQHELVFVFKHGRAPHRNNVQLGQFGRHRTNVWRYGGANSFSRSTAEGNLLALHPTVKPLALVADAISDCSARGDIVLDPFLGSGTTLIAAERTCRRCRGIEIDPHYVDVAIRRWQTLTRRKATRTADGRCFDDIAAESASGAGGDGDR